MDYACCRFFLFVNGQHFSLVHCRWSWQRNYNFRGRKAKPLKITKNSSSAHEENSFYLCTLSFFSKLTLRIGYEKSKYWSFPLMYSCHFLNESWFIIKTKDELSIPKGPCFKDLHIQVWWSTVNLCFGHEIRAKPL